LLAFGGRQLWMWQQERRSDPWQALQAWGAGVGRPPAPGETTLEYAEALATLAEGWSATAPVGGNDLSSMARAAAGEARALGNAAAAVHYAQPGARAGAIRAADAHWARLRPLLTPLARHYRRRWRRR
ncbi:MAG: hypothetical protein ACRC1H_13030, partial [Caldilineaceae bacterium]